MGLRWMMSDPAQIFHRSRLAYFRLPSETCRRMLGLNSSLKIGYYFGVRERKIYAIVRDLEMLITDDARFSFIHSFSWMHGGWVQLSWKLSSILTRESRLRTSLLCRSETLLHRFDAVVLLHYPSSVHPIFGR